MSVWAASCLLFYYILIGYLLLMIQLVPFFLEDFSSFTCGELVCAGTGCEDVMEVTAERVSAGGGYPRSARAQR
mgnify:CR=1 FL=1